MLCVLQMLLLDTLLALLLSFNHLVWFVACLSCFMPAFSLPFFLSLFLLSSFVSSFRCAFFLPIFPFFRLFLLRVIVCLQYAFNLFSHNSPMTDNGYNEEEMKMVKETKKIWGNQDVSITATCIRVPIMRAHAESINLEFERDVSEEEVSSEKKWSSFTLGQYFACCNAPFGMT